MAKKPDVNQPVAVQRIAKRSDSYAVLYANDTQVQTSPWDIRLIFGRIDTLPTAEDPKLEVIQIGEVSMSLQHAKKIVGILLDQITNYEKQIGPIPTPD